MTGEVEDAAVWDAAGVKERDQRTAPPVETCPLSVVASEDHSQKLHAFVRDRTVVEHGGRRARGEDGS